MQTWEIKAKAANTGLMRAAHEAVGGPYLEDRRTKLLLDNCIRINEGRPLVNVVDKEQWF